MHLLLALLPLLGSEPVAPPLTLDRGPGEVALQIPAQEELTFSVAIDLGRMGMLGLGKVTLQAEHGLEPGPLPLPGQPASAPRRYAEIRSTARGSYLGYELEHVLTTRHLLDQAWPKIVHTDVQSGSENRRRELAFGNREDSVHVRYWSDGHCKGCERSEHEVESLLPWGSTHHCKKCKRAEHRQFGESRTRSAPDGTLDMLSALYLARAVVLEDVNSVRFPMLDKLELWDVELTLGEEVTRRTEAGEFTCREVRLASQVPAGETDRGEEEFSGLFGIRGALRVYVESNTGIPIWIEGSVPAGPLQVDVVVRLEAAAGVLWPSSAGSSQKEIETTLEGEKGSLREPSLGPSSPVG